MHSDEALAYWGDRFAAAHLSVHLSFYRFMSLPVAQRERWLSIGAVYPAPEPDVAAAESTAQLHGDRLITRMRPTGGRFRRPWPFRRRGRVG